jgi:exodeoxyribonuclease-3
MKIASWNVNSIKTRLQHVQNWLQDTGVEILMIQELKGLDFPGAAFDEIGYNHEAVTQKSYNGVAIISKYPIAVILDKLPGDEDDLQARYLEVEIEGLRCINIYLPNGNPIDTEKFPYKLGWMKRLYDRLADLRAQEIPFLVGGDYNVIPEAEDCYDVKAYANDALFQPESRAAFRALKNLGLTDALRAVNPHAGTYTYWDYQAGAWIKDNGIRIDHFLLSPAVTDRLLNCEVDKNPRSLEQPSDHTPIILSLAANKKS